MVKFTELNHLNGYNIRVVGAEDIAHLQSLLIRCEDYFLMVSGSPPDSSAAHSLLASKPEGKTIEDKLILGIYDQADDMVGALDNH